MVSWVEELTASSEVAQGFVTAAAAVLGPDAAITAGAAPVTASEVLGDDIGRAIAAPLLVAGEPVGEIALVLTAAFADALEGTASDELLATAILTPFEATAQAVCELTGLEAELGTPQLVEPAAVGGDGEAVAYPILADNAPAACLIVTVTDASAAGDPAIAGDNPAFVFATGDGADSFVLADVEMGITAELGRTRMTVRELLSITPGAVIDLDRAAGAPVDVLVNGTLIARGEVVVIDEEFGIRISEIPPHTASTH